MTFDLDTALKDSFYMIASFDETGDISDHTFVTAMGLLRVGYDTIIGSQDGNSLVEKVNRLLKI